MARLNISMILVFAVPPQEIPDMLLNVSRFASRAATSTEGSHAFLHIPNDADRVAAALTLGEIAKPYRSSLLICQDEDDGGEIEKKLHFLVEELQIRARVRRFLWVRTEEPSQMAIVRAFMPGDPMFDPRGVWEGLA
jgi:hypothetical protein